MTNDPRTVVRRYVEEVWNEGNTAAVDELVAPDFVDHDPSNPPNLPPGAQGLKQHVAAMRAAFPDTQFTIEDVIVGETRSLLDGPYEERTKARL